MAQNHEYAANFLLGKHYRKQKHHVINSPNHESNSRANNSASTYSPSSNAIGLNQITKSHNPTTPNF